MKILSIIISFMLLLPGLSFASQCDGKAVLDTIINGEAKQVITQTPNILDDVIAETEKKILNGGVVRKFAWRTVSVWGITLFTILDATELMEDPGIQQAAPAQLTTSELKLAGVTRAGVYASGQNVDYDPPYIGAENNGVTFTFNSNGSISVTYQQLENQSHTHDLGWWVRTWDAQGNLTYETHGLRHAIPLPTYVNNTGQTITQTSNFDLNDGDLRDWFNAPEQQQKYCDLPRAVTTTDPTSDPTVKMMPTTLTPSVVEKPKTDASTGEKTDPKTGENLTGTMNPQDPTDSFTPPNEPGAPDFDTSIVAPEKKSIPTLITSWLDNAPFMQAIDNFGIDNTVGSPIIHFDFFGLKTFDMDFSQWEDIYAGVAAILISIAYIMAVLIVFGGSRP